MVKGQEPEGSTLVRMSCTRTRARGTRWEAKEGELLTGWEVVWLLAGVCVEMGKRKGAGQLATVVYRWSELRTEIGDSATKSVAQRGTSTRIARLGDGDLAILRGPLDKCWTPPLF